MELELTDKGKAYTQRLSLSSVDETNIDRRWDFAMLVYITGPGLDDEEAEEKVGTEGKKVVRRLFEEGYIEAVD